ncbi:rhomboid family intramembrane serine protease [Bacillus shivajii]|uniref:rhomboid family intramembrane serine protease n=1 Tax=Bacillus shivajii TaxID=1983719 RepID=UPI001CF96D2E|nr:rhomboid family intramembrane serine protease [Bacillus shivajii]UCZ54555.1 rhomboid family intramembrane serine protease [Bacillus shivajii]
MNTMTLSLRFWEIVYHLVVKEGMRVVHINKNASEVWVEDDRKEPYQIIRLAEKDLDWSNQLKQDIKSTHERAKQVRKQLGLRQANVVNVIISQYPPVDDYQEIVDQPLPFSAGGKQQQRTILVTLDNLTETLFPLATEWSLHEMPSFISSDRVEDEESVIRSLRRAVQHSSDKRLEGERNLFFFGKPIFTYIILGCILAVYTVVEQFGSTTNPETLITFGAKFNPLILEGEWWRFFSAMFLHIGIFHLLMNSLALFYLGGAVERIFGTSRFFIIYFLAGLAGSVASFAFNENVSAGASGAIFGCFGALLYFGVRYKRLFFRTMGMNVIVILVINLAFGFMVPMVDNGAHIGGLIGGFVASAIVGMPNHSHQPKRLVAFISGGLALIALLFYAYNQEGTGQSYAVYYQIGTEYMKSEQYEDAQPYFEKVVNNDHIQDEELIAQSYFQLGSIEISSENFDQAKEYLGNTVSLSPSFFEGQYNLAVVYYYQGNYEEAYEQLQKAMEIQPNHEKAIQLEEELLRHLERSS